MAERDNRAAKAAVGISAGAAVIAALALLTRQAKAAPPGEEGEAAQLPQELWNLIIAIAESADDVDAGIKDVVDKLSQLAINVQGFPPNARSMTAVRVACLVVAQPYQFPTLLVPDGMSLHLLAWPLNPPASLISVGSSAAECSNINQSYPLVPGGTVDYFVQNADTLWVSANIVPAWVVATAEQRRA